MLCYFSLHRALLKCPLSILAKCVFYREYRYSKMTEKQQGAIPGVCPIGVSVKRELSVNLVTTATFFCLQGSC